MMWRSRAISRRFFTTMVEVNKADHHIFERLTPSTSEPPVTLIQDPAAAKQAVKILMSLGPDHFHACDTEVADIDLKKVGPVGNGRVTCLSVFSGPDVDFGNGPRLWVDNMDSSEGTLEYMREFLESKAVKKGLGGDTMHMARLWNTSRTHRGGYSLESLTADLMGQRKRPMKEIFGTPKLRKDGSPGKELILPSIRELQRSAESRDRWIRYSTYDAESTWFLHELLKAKLEQMIWFEGRNPDGSVQPKNMYEFYQKYLAPFGECLTDIERKGMLVDREQLASIETMAVNDSIELKEKFLQWVKKFCPDGDRFNVHSASQKQQLLFAPCKNSKGEIILEKEREFIVENTEGYVEPGKEKALKTRKITISGLGIPAKKNTAKGLPTASGEVLRDLAGYPNEKPPKYGRIYDHFQNKSEGEEACQALDALCGISSTNTMLNTFILPLQELADENGRVHCSLNLNTDTGRLSSRRPNLQNQPALEKDRYKIRDAFVAEKGNTLIVADYSQLELRLLAHVTNCKGMIDAFKAGGDFHSRTAMGMYEYVAEAVDKGEALLEWDHSKGSPPAPLLKEKFASERKNAKILNFSIAYGKTPYGLAKDFNVSRSEAAETLEKWYADRPEVRIWQQNSIRTAQLFGYTRTLMGRYRMLPDAMLRGNSIPDKKARSHAERAAINTPIQGAASDVVMMAMLRIHADEQLKGMGYEMISQVHDEIILEGPAECSKEACSRVVNLMENPFNNPLSVDLDVDANVDTSWYKAK